MRPAFYMYQQSKGALPNFSRDSSEDRVIRRALIQSGKHPEYAEGHAKSAEKRGSSIDARRARQVAARKAGDNGRR
jgi:hypothetical protein